MQSGYGILYGIRLYLAVDRKIGAVHNRTQRTLQLQARNQISKTKSIDIACSVRSRYTAVAHLSCTLAANTWQRKGIEGH